MDDEKKKRLEAEGFRIGTIAEFLDLTPEEQDELVAELKQRFDLKNDAVELLVEDVLDHVFLTIKLAKRFQSIKEQ